MTLAIVGNKTPTIKPGDLIRTPSGETGTVLWINIDGSREIELLGGERVALLSALLFLVRAAVPMPWPSHALHKYSVNGD